MFYLISAVFGGASGIAWVAVTGSNDIPYLVIIGYSVAVALLAELAEGALKRRRIRRALPRRRAHARNQPTKPRKAA